MPWRGFRHARLLGTDVEVRVDVDDPGVARRVDDVVIAEVERLQSVFSVFEPDSELERWKCGEVPRVSRELAAVLALALDWQLRSDGAFNPAAGLAVRAWRAAADRGTPVTDAERRAIAASIRAPRWEMRDGSPVALDDCGPVDLHAIAKGWIVDRALDAGWASGQMAGLVVNAGGDLAHRGRAAIRVGIEDPHRPYDNVAPLTTIELRGAALATSGDRRRGVRIGGRWYGHVIDPRTASPVGAVASISVIAHDAATADALATMLGVEGAHSDVMRLADRLGAACLVVADDRTVHASEAWRWRRRQRAGDQAG